MSVSKEIMEKAEAEAQAVLKRSIQEEDALYEKFKAAGQVGLDEHTDEYKAIHRKAWAEIEEIRKKYGIEPAPKE